MFRPSSHPPAPQEALHSSPHTAIRRISTPSTPTSEPPQSGTVSPTSQIGPAHPIQTAHIAAMITLIGSP